MLLDSFMATLSKHDQADEGKQTNVILLLHFTAVYSRHLFVKEVSFI